MYMYICNPGHRVSRPRGTGSVGDSVGEGNSNAYVCNMHVCYMYVCYMYVSNLTQQGRTPRKVPRRKQWRGKTKIHTSQDTHKPSFCT